MPTPQELTGPFLDAFNQRDRLALRALLAPARVHARPAGGALGMAGEVMAQSERDRAVRSGSSVRVRELIESGDAIVAGITINDARDRGHGRNEPGRERDETPSDGVNADLQGQATDGDEGRVIRIRNARTADVPGIASFVNAYAQERILLAKERVTLYEDIQEFRVAEAVWPGQGTGATDRRELIGCGALHVMWEDLAEIRTVAVASAWRGHGVGRLILEALLEQARGLGVRRLFCLTFEVDFFARQGFHAVDGTPVSNEVFAQLLRSLDEGVAEFLDLARVKPNTLGNTRMIREL